MSDWKVIDHTVGLNQAIDATWSTVGADGSTIYPQHPLLTRIRCKDVATTNYGVGEFIYLKGVASTAVGSVVTYEADGTTALAVADATGPVAVAMSANVANQYGWYQIFGKGVGKVLTGFADNALCFLTGTAGSVDDTDVAGDCIIGMRGASAIGTPSAGLALLTLSYPAVTDNL